MNSAHFKTLDLNLLRVFIALLDEKSATRAGARLGLTQSAVSHALGRLRLSLDDELFVRGPAGLQPTPRAAEMGQQVRAALKLLESAVSDPAFDPAVDRRVFAIAASGYVCSVLMPAVVRRLLAEAPGVRLHLRGLDAALTEDLDRGRLDMAIGGFEHVARRFRYTELFTETGVWVMRADHPAAANGPVHISALAGLPHLLVSSGEDADLAGGRDLGLRRLTSWSDDYALGAASIGDMEGPVTVPDSYSAMAMVSQTDLAALLPRRQATLALQKGRLILVEPEHRPEPVSFGAVIRATESEAGPTAWLLRIIAEAASAI
jgi:DNA-binding transcriptional LysR family regulator